MNQEEELAMLLGKGNYNHFDFKKKDEKLLFDDMSPPQKQPSPNKQKMRYE